MDPDWIGITFDPANMLVEGKEDWEFGLRLLNKYIANVHVKNVIWKPSKEGWTWCWAPLKEGMIDWLDLTSLLNQTGYQGDFAIEDFLAPQDTFKNAINHIKTLTETMQEMVDSHDTDIPLYHGDCHPAYQSPGLI